MNILHLENQVRNLGFQTLREEIPQGVPTFYVLRSVNSFIRSMIEHTRNTKSKRILNELYQRNCARLKVNIEEFCQYELLYTYNRLKTLHIPQSHRKPYNQFRESYYGAICLIEAQYRSLYNRQKHVMIAIPAIEV